MFNLTKGLLDVLSRPALESEQRPIDAIEGISECFSLAERRGGRAEDVTSLLRCDNCGRVIATDIEPEAFDEVANRWFCRPCREAPVRELSLAEAWLARRRHE